MTGRVDDYGRALLPIAVAVNENGTTTPLEAWVDTGFTGHDYLAIEPISGDYYVGKTMSEAGLAAQL